MDVFAQGHSTDIIGYFQIHPDAVLGSILFEMQPESLLIFSKSSFHVKFQVKGKTSRNTEFLFQQFLRIIRRNSLLVKYKSIFHTVEIIPHFVLNCKRVIHRQSILIQ